MTTVGTLAAPALDLFLAYSGTPDSQTWLQGQGSQGKHLSGDPTTFARKFRKEPTINKIHTARAYSPAPATASDITDHTAARYLKQQSGEFPMPGAAPTVKLKDGTCIVPSQYLLFNHTLATVQALLDRIHYKDNLLLIAGCEAGDPDQMYLQVGVIGTENYPYRISEALPKKIVYGRKWRIEKHFPTSELLQTAFLALKCAEEHEVRELLVYKGRTIFNNHFDLPLMARQLNDEELSGTKGHVTSLSDAVQLFNHVRFNGCLVTPIEVLPRRNHRTLITVRFNPDPETSRCCPEFEGCELEFLCESDSPSHIIYGLMDAILDRINRHIEEHFTFGGFARFSRAIGIENLRKVIQAQRDRHRLEMPPLEEATAFFQGAQLLNGAISSFRPPQNPHLSETALAYLESQGPLEGYLPK